MVKDVKKTGEDMIYTFERKKGSLSTIQQENATENEKLYADFVGNANGDIKERLDCLSGDIASIDYSDWFHGPFLLLVFDKNRKKLFLTSHMFGSPVPVYYTTVENTIFITTSLKSLKEKANIPFILNNKNIPDYLLNGYIKGEKTLVSDVNKLPQDKALSASRFCARLVTKKTGFAGEFSNVSDKHERYEKTVFSSVKNNIPVLSDNENFSIALSGGFDSNCILYSLKKLFPEKNIDAVSIGGLKGRDESIVAKEIAQLYKGVSFDSTLVTPETFTHFDEIVERLEGNVFEIGVFLQYELSKFLKEKGINHLICGECADQVFHENTYKKTSRKVKKYSYEYTPLEMGAYTVLKKSSYMLESFGIKGYYPFLDNEMIALGHDFRSLNGCTKEFHKAECKRLFDDEISSKLVKQGGTTQMMALFDDGFDCLKEAKKSKFYDEKYTPFEFGEGETEKVFYAWLRYLEIFEKIYCDR